MRYSVNESSFLFTIQEMIYRNGMIWFADSSCNEIYSYDVDSRQVEMIAKLQCEEEYQNKLIGDIVLCEDTLFAIPFSAQKMHEINILNKEVSEQAIGLKEPSGYAKYAETAKFNSAHRYKDFLYLVGATYPAIVEYNLLTKDLKYYDGWLGECSKFSNKEENFFFKKSIMINNKIYAPSCMGNGVLEFDVETKVFIWNEVGSEDCTYSSITLYGDWFWLSPRGKGPIVKWNKNTKEWKEIQEYPDLYEPCDGSFGDIIHFNGFLYCIPICSSVILRVEEETDKIEVFMQEYGDWKFSSVCNTGEQLFFYLHDKLQFIVLHKNGDIEIRGLNMPEKQNKYHIAHRSHTYKVFKGEEKAKENEIFYERYGDELIYFIEYI